MQVRSYIEWRRTMSVSDKYSRELKIACDARDRLRHQRFAKQSLRKRF
jgi:hypothetical protein